MNPVIVVYLFVIYVVPVLLGAWTLYFVIRKAVAHGIRDAERNRVVDGPAKHRSSTPSAAE